MDLKNPETDILLIEAIISIPSCLDKCQKMFRDINGNDDYMQQIKKCTEAWFQNYMDTLACNVSTKKAEVWTDSTSHLI